MHPITTLDLSIRCTNALQSMGVSNLSQLSSYSKTDLKWSHRFSTKSIEEIDYYMIKFNISWKTSSDSTHCSICGFHLNDEGNCIVGH